MTVKETRKFFRWLSLIAITLLMATMPLRPSNVEMLEEKLTDAQGAERLKILAALVEACSDDRPLKAIAYTDEITRLLEKYPSPALQIRIYGFLGFSHLIIAEYPRAEALMVQSLELSRRIGDPLAEADALINLGYFRWNVNNYQEAAALFEQAREIYQKKNHEPGLAKTNRMMAYLHWKLSNYTVALEFIYNAEQLARRLSLRWDIADLTNLSGILYIELGQYRESMAKFQEAHQLFQKIGASRGVARALNNLGLTYGKLGDFNQALECFKKSRELNNKLGLRQFYANNINNIGEIHAHMKNYPLALKFLSDALALKENLKDRTSLTYTLTILGKTLREAGKLRESQIHLERAVEISREIQTSGDLRAATLQLSLTFEAQKDFKNALYYYQLYKQQNDSISSENTQKRILEFRTRSDVEKKEKQLQLLKKDEQINQLELERQTFVKNFLLIISFFVILLVFLFYRRYRFKARLSGILEHEIREHRRTAAMLQESEEKFRILAEKSVVGICIIQNQIICYANPRFQALFGYSQEELTGMRPAQLALDEDRPLVEQAGRRRLEGSGESIAFEYRASSKYKKILYLENYGILTHYDGAPAILETVIDITERKQAEAEVLNSQKMESIGILAGGIANDFNKLISLIQEKLSSIITMLPDDSKQSLMLKSSLNTSHQAHELVQKLITFSEGGWAAPRKVRFANLLKNTINQYSSVKPFIRDVAIAPNLKHIHGDPRQLKQVLRNVLQNAEEAAGNPKEIRISAVNVQTDGDNMFSLEPGEYVKITISDNGRGIPKENLEKVFEPYFSTKKTVTQKGMGLGLAICYSIIKRHKGQITIQSAEGSGTTVEIILPVWR